MLTMSHYVFLYTPSCIGVVISFESSEYTVYEEDQFVEVCVELLEGKIIRTIPVTISTVMVSAGMYVYFHFKYTHSSYTIVGEEHEMHGRMLLSHSCIAWLIHSNYLVTPTCRSHGSRDTRL